MVCRNMDIVHNPHSVEATLRVVEDVVLLAGVAVVDQVALLVVDPRLQEASLAPAPYQSSISD